MRREEGNSSGYEVFLDDIALLGAAGIKRASIFYFGFGSGSWRSHWADFFGNHVRAEGQTADRS